MQNRYIAEVAKSHEPIAVGWCKFKCALSSGQGVRQASCILVKPAKGNSIERDTGIEPSHFLVTRNNCRKAQLALASRILC